MKVVSSFVTSCIFTVVSAAFYAASFLSLEYCWYVSFFCFVSLFFQKPSSYSNAALIGFLWGAVAYPATLSALLEVVFRVGEGPLSYWYAAAFVGYFVFFSVLWCVAARWCALQARSWAWGWLLSSYALFFWMHTGFFYFLTGEFYGYGLASPLVPLMVSPTVLGLLPVLGWYGLLAALLFLQVGVSQQKTVWIFGGMLPFFLGILFFDKKDFCVSKNDKVVVISKMFYARMPYERAQEVYELLFKAERENPNATLFVLPESTFPFPLNEYTYVQDLWLRSGILNQKALILGSHYLEIDEHGQEHLYNSVYVFHKRRIIFRYDKKQLLPFFEKQTGGHVSPFLVGKVPFERGKTAQEQCVVPELGIVSFRICSELLWDMPVEKQVILLVHDGHYRFLYFPQLFKLFAHFHAYAKGSKLLYCSWK